MPTPTATLSGKYPRRVQETTRAMNSSAPENGGAELTVQDSGPDAGYLVYVYNILDREHLVQQPPLFPAFHIPACPKGQKFSYTIISAFVNEVFNRAGTYETYTKRVDGRKCATSLLNPDAMPSIDWSVQVTEWVSPGGAGNNLNKLGVFWSLTRPDETEKLDEEIEIFKKILYQTAQGYVRKAENLHISPRHEDRMEIGPWHHFFADYLGITAPWHTPMHHMTSCPNCGDAIREGLIYHRNAFNEKCIIDPVKYAKLISLAQPVARAEEDSEEELVEVKPKGKRKASA